MNHSHLSLLDSCSTKSNKEVAAWARLEGKSEAMAADLLRSASLGRKQKEQTLASAGTFCPRCVASATLGAALALLLDRIILSGY